MVAIKIKPNQFIIKEGEIDTLGDILDVFGAFELDDEIFGLDEGDFVGESDIFGLFEGDTDALGLVEGENFGPTEGNADNFGENFGEIFGSTEPNPFGKHEE